MKKALALALAAIMLAAALASCSVSPGASLGANIRVTSSDALAAAEWLSERLGDKLTDRVVIGTDAAALGVNVDTLEDDGFVIRVLGEEIALIGSAPAGLDRAVRKYAKAVEKGERVADETYHEGYRIEELRLAGNDISTYSIALDCGNEYMRNWVEKNAAEPFAALVKRACGADISVGGEAPHKIVFRLIEDGGFKESSYHYFFSGDDLVFEFAQLGGARNAFVKFLENECGWDDLMFGRDELREADLVDVAETTDVLCHPRFDGIRLTSFSQLAADNSLGQINSTAFIYKYRVESAHHYLGTVWARDYGWFATRHYPCLTSEDVLDAVFEDVTEYLKGLLADGKKKIGEDIVAVNMGTQDESRDWCTCKDCLKLYRDEGSWSGPLISFLNRFDEMMDDAGYEGLKYPTFGYVGSNKPPKTIVPSKDIYITFVYNNSCTHHCIDGTQCQNDSTNPHYAEYVRGWLDLTPNVYVRPAPLSAPVHAFTIIDQVWDDVKWLGDIGVKCIYNEIYTWKELDTNLVATELWEAMTFNPDMTRAEYYEEAGRLLEKYYGPGWRHVFNYLDMLEEAENSMGKCWSIWNNSYMNEYDAEQFDFETYLSSWDEMIAELEAARCEVDDRAQEDRVDRLLVAAIYEGCLASYYGAYEDYDDERIALLDERWAYMIERAKHSGVYDALVEVDVRDTLEDTAWAGAWTTDYTGQKNNLRLEIVTKIGGKQMVRPAPEKYAENASDDD